jgi:hypothetical protein
MPALTGEWSGRTARCARRLDLMDEDVREAVAGVTMHAELKRLFQTGSVKS